jgi:dTDP-4-dehydrorhamnose reductase
MTKILITGKNGQVGWELQRVLAPLGEVIAIDRKEMDLANPDAIRARIREIKPDIIVNAAAYTAVDKAESEPDLALAVNGIAPGILAEEAKRLGALLVHYSTDYVFDGTKSSPYAEEDSPNPLNVYGKTKLAGERAIAASGADYLILRTSWVYSARGKNFMLTILRLARERDELRIVDDQVGAPTSSIAIAQATARILAQVFSPITHHPSLEFLPSQGEGQDGGGVTIPHSPFTIHRSPFTIHPSPIIHHPLHTTELNGIYHMSASGATSWFGFATEILRISGQTTPVRSIPSSEYPSPAARPANSVLDNTKFRTSFGLELPAWQSSLKQCLAEYGHVHAA